jgi:HPt (histidine-containing phosphotransfer) domain-containing protein
MTQFDARLAQLRVRFQARAAEDRARLAVALAARDLAQIRRLSHGLSGSGGVFGFASLSEAAEAVELAADEQRAWGEIEGLCHVLACAIDEAVQPL